MKEEFAALRRHSKKHATRIETKLNQLKNEQEAPRMELKNKIIEAQKKIVETLTECEINIGRLYEKYAARFPEAKDLWSTLSKVEETHANLLKTMHRIFDKGNIFYNLGKFGDAAIQPTIDLINRSLKEADAPGFKAADAMKTGLKIESSLIDAHFYDIVDSDAPEFKIIAARLSSETKHHAELIRHYFEKHIEDSGLQA